MDRRRKNAKHRIVVLNKEEKVMIDREGKVPYLVWKKEGKRIRNGGKREDAILRAIDR